MNLSTTGVITALYSLLGKCCSLTNLSYSTIRHTQYTDLSTVALNHPQLKTDLNPDFFGYIVSYNFTLNFKLLQAYFLWGCLVTGRSNLSLCLQLGTARNLCLVPMGSTLLHPEHLPGTRKDGHTHQGWCQTTSPSSSLMKSWKAPAAP